MAKGNSKTIHAGLYHICLLCFKYMPLVATLAFTVDCCLLLTGLQLKFMALSFGTSLTSAITLFAASYTFRFCWLHRAAILYNFIMALCINYEVVFGFGYLRTHARVLMLIAGLCILAMVVRRHGICSNDD